MPGDAQAVLQTASAGPQPETEKPSPSRILVIGSGPIIIGQAAEFDYAGTQACKALREEGYRVILVNSNPATIMTDLDMADVVYLEPLTPESLEAIIAKERPDGLLPTLGGQTGLNLAVALAERGVLDRYGVRLLGTPLASIQKAEDRELFKETMERIGEPVPESAIVHNMEEGMAFIEQIGLPVILRPAYTLGGTGGGIAETLEEFKAILMRGLRQSPIGQVLVERSIRGWKEIEYEVMRDGAGTCITVCNMENLDPVGVHTGDSIVVAPSQTLTDREYQMLRSAALRIIDALEIEGGCNVQFALDPHSERYYVIEVNPRVSRSSALASKATGYPIAKIAAKIAVGKRLDEIVNPVTGTTYASFEPALDYVVVKIPRWPFDKFPQADRRLGTQMKATGEVMALDRTFEAALQKAVRSLDIGVEGLAWPDGDQWSDGELRQRLAGEPDDRRIFDVAEALRRGHPVDEVAAWTGIDPWFLWKIRAILDEEEQMLREGFTSPERARIWKTMGFSDRRIAELTGLDVQEVRRRRTAWGIRPSYLVVDTCAAEFASRTPYYYSTYRGEDEVRGGAGPKALVLGSGPIRIGQGIEFDYCSVHAVWALRRLGFETVIINNNPETVSTDFDTADRLYFEPLTAEDVLNVIEREGIDQVYVQFGGQTAINLAAELAEYGVSVCGTPVEALDAAEDRERFRQLLDQLEIPQTRGGTAFDVPGARAIAEAVGYPVVVRPSYVIGGRAMEVCWNVQELEAYMSRAARVTPDHPVLVDHYLPGKEVEVDAISDGRDVLIPGIFEHIERAGVHSGDSMAVYPDQTLTQDERAQMIRVTEQIARALGIVGLMNIQFVILDGTVYVLEVNPRASRTVPILSKVTGVPMVELAVRVQQGERLSKLGWGTGLRPRGPRVVVKAPVFSFSKMSGLDIHLGPEMKSTGEVLGVGESFGEALEKAFSAAGIQVPDGGGVFGSVSDREKPRVMDDLVALAELGYTLYATPGTAAALEQRGVPVRRVEKNAEAVADLLRSGRVGLVINLPTHGQDAQRFGFALRRMTVEMRVSCLTAGDTVRALVEGLRARRREAGVRVLPLE
ncbi:carbamoyl-phosphate synthase large subunit [Kyrpidia tusciae]|uniref:Carbamoyl phosphate synthase large chain n=1 Tax=Kyrpidia tusciae (strain DSM 2912 / NBRC 15312 / T2) TaxID=562970 RepID=D5WRE8_KYRT2|nr:carbamoyl-phosphate synthase large subunit [Kyrpidia tusciae]ADG06878.1 carbamoyl-phosphate synthase, large subunit [Kyrpidia tusciae DSM 2912]